jgi:hypothetical protein
VVEMRRMRDWVREQYMESWLKTKHMRPPYRFTVQEKVELKVRPHDIISIYHLNNHAIVKTI